MRELVEGEWPLWRDMAIDASTDSPDSFRPTTADHLATSNAEWADLIDSTVRHPRGCLWFAEVDGEQVGKVFARIDEALEAVEFGAMWVAPSARGAGVGTALLGAVRAWAIDQGARTLECWVTEGNETAVRLYATAGLIATEDTQFLREGSDLIVRKMRATISTHA